MGTQAREIVSNEARGKITWVQPHVGATGERAFRYALASYFLAQQGRSAFAETVGQDSYGAAPRTRAEYTWDLGTPAGAYRTIGTNLLRRDFGCGTVLVNTNPSGSTPVTVSLGRTYYNEFGSSVTTVTLPGTSGKILRGSD